MSNLFKDGLNWKGDAGNSNLITEAQNSKILYETIGKSIH